MSNSIQPVVELHGKQSIVNGENIAAVFGKRPSYVSKRIKVIIKRLAKSSAKSSANFIPRNYIGEDGKEHESWAMNRVAFDYLVLGFTGDKAFEYRTQYVEKFHRNQNILIQQKIHSALPQWQEARLGGKETRHTFTDAIQSLQGYAKANGSKNYGRMYITYTKMIHTALFTWGKSYKFNRDDCSPSQLDDIKTVENLCAKAIEYALLNNVEYHQIYRECQAVAIAIADVIGVSNVPASSIGLEE